MSDILRFTLGGIANTTLGVELMPEFDEPILPKTRDNSVTIPGRNGVHLFNTDLGPRVIVLDLVAIDSSTPETLQALIKTFSQVLLDQDGHPEDVALVLSKEPNYTYTVRYAGSMPLQRIIGGSKGFFSLPLLAADPFSYATEDTDTYNVVAAYQTMAVVNAGDYRTPPTMTITMKAGSVDVTGFTLITRQIK